MSTITYRLLGETIGFLITTTDNAVPPALVDPQSLEVELESDGQPEQVFVWGTDAEITRLAGAAKGKFVFARDADVVGPTKYTTTYEVPGSPGAVIKDVQHVIVQDAS